ncbi:MAG: condensation domain-containing protein, partial [Ginsengibacter sp.]
LHILGAYHERVPLGVSGELCIGGQGVARGYLNSTELTAEKFVADPFNKGSKIYKTGDLARWLPDGNIEYLGRKDEQVKIRGYRIELGEIEGVLQGCYLVSQAVVLAKENKEGGKRLVAYVVPTDAFEKETIQDFLKGVLPEYMIPVQWVEMETLPLTSNGKTDRRALPDPDVLELLSDQYIAPRNDFEKAIAIIWQDLLDVEAVGIHDNFFELGGDSIIIIQIVSRARREGYEFLVSDVFTHQTIARLSAMMDQKTGSSSVAFGEQGMLTGESGLLPIQQWYFEGEEKSISHFNQSVLISIDKSVTEVELENVLDQLTTHHDALHFIYHKKDDIWKQEYGTHKGVFIVDDLQEATKNTIAGIITQQSEIHQRSLNIESGHIIRMALMKTPVSETNNRLLLVIHHLAVDGISWRILLEDLELLLTSLRTGVPSELGFRSTSYRQWYEALEIYGKSNRLKTQQGYWEQVLDSYQPLPVDTKFQGLLKMADMQLELSRLDVVNTKALIQEVPGVYHTEINDVLMATLAITLCEWTNKESIVIGLEGHGREEIADNIDISRTVGWFTTMYPVLLKLEPGSEIANVIKEVKEQLRKVPDKGIGFGVLKYINKEVKFSANKNWDVVFNYFGQLDNVLSNSKWLGSAVESKGTGIGENHLSRELISVNAAVQGGELILNWSYSSLHYNPETIKALTDHYNTNIKLIISHCLEQQKSPSIYTPSDYGLGVEVSNVELDLFLDEAYNESTRRYWMEGLYRLSGLQQGMFFHSLYDKGGAYMEQFCCDLIDLNISIFSKSWKHIMQNHSILRSAFYYDAFSIPVQCVYSKVKLPVEVLDYREMDTDEQAEAITLYKEEDRQKGFDFKAAPLMRVALIRLSEDRYTMVWCFHHVLFDGWSLAVLMEEFLTTYELLITGIEVKGVEEDRYEDYIRYIERGHKEKEELYWRNYMQGVEHSTLLPFIASTTERNKGLGAYKSTSIYIDPVLTVQVQNYAQKHRFTINTLMQGIWSCLLHRYTGSSYIVYGVIVSGRPDDLPGVENRVGLYINTLPLHSNIQEEKSVVEWLQNLQAEQVNSRNYQYTPLQTIQSWTGVKGDLFDSILVFENYPVS